VKYTVSLVDVRIDNYKGTLETLRRNLIDHASIQCPVITYRVLDVVTGVRKCFLYVFGQVRVLRWSTGDLQVLSELNYTSKANHDLDKGCLEGTRTEIIDAIVHWALGADVPSSVTSNSRTLSLNESSRVLWLCGTAGAGKSSILRSCAERVRELGRMGSYYGFSKNEADANLTNLFSTIALELAELDDSRKQRLIDVAKKHITIRRSNNCKSQFENFIVASFEDDQAVGETVVFIDAFDESGNERDRAEALAILTKHASKFPRGLRVVVTSRYERDIQDAVRNARQSQVPPAVEIMHVDNIPADQTSRDIATYIRTELDNVDEFGGEEYQEYEKQRGELIKKAGTSFQWAATACRFICDYYGGVNPWKRLRKMLDADKELYGLYDTIMKGHCNPSDGEAVQQVKSILGRIISAREPLSFHALVHLVPANSILTPLDIATQRKIVKSLGALLSGTDSDDKPIVPLHTSYRDFLCDPKDNEYFYIDQGEANRYMTLGCFRAMDQTLTFNICQIPTSFLRNVDIPNIKGLVEKHIPCHLSYACRFWAFHMTSTSSGEFAQQCLESFFWKDFLHWLEVMSLTENSPQVALAPLDTIPVSRGPI
jgi:hypothetical protein